MMERLQMGYLSAGSTCDIFLSCSPPGSRTAPGRVGHKGSLNIPVQYMQNQQYKITNFRLARIFQSINQQLQFFLIPIAIT